ncbi:hypothetical protein HOY80DRAFT_1046121 [Tuber brumale]|nr:hypothetical protein HOY80DRAFT_1046121 [Tuber brumale]
MPDQQQPISLEEEIRLDLKSWPRRRMFTAKACPRRLQILQEAYTAIKKVSNSKGNTNHQPKGLYFRYHYQVYQFLKLQLQQEWKALEGPNLFSGLTSPIVPRKQLAQKVVEGGGWGRRVRNRILANEVSWVKYRTIPMPGQGKHSKVISLLEDPDTILAVRSYILQVGEKLTAFGLVKAIAAYWKESMDDDDITNWSVNNVAREVERTIGSRTARMWLQKLGFNYKEYRKGVYNDGHEREDEIPKPLHLSSIIQLLILVTQDECTFNSNDGRHYIWVHPEHQPLRKKGHGQGLHVSDFLTPIGRLGDGDACVIMKCGGDTWWNGDRLLEQVIDKAIPAFERQFPGCKALFAFDNARNHLKFADDALRVSEMNLEPGGKYAKQMHDTYVIDVNHSDGGYIQSLTLPD